ncbi:hypothetical protein FOCC_FOCC009600 [Frankliniella occidentalis]|nr:hypothetical protein FOCC_FOCC009600 [Frankliniella occidentalis]
MGHSGAGMVYSSALHGALGPLPRRATGLQVSKLLSGVVGARARVGERKEWRQSAGQSLLLYAKMNWSECVGVVCEGPHPGAALARRRARVRAARRRPAGRHGVVQRAALGAAGAHGAGAAAGGAHPAGHHAGRRAGPRAHGLAGQEAARCAGTSSDFVPGWSSEIFAVQVCFHLFNFSPSFSSAFEVGLCLSAGPAPPLPFASCPCYYLCNSGVQRNVIELCSNWADNFGFQNGQANSESSEDPDRWQAVFAAVTDRELRLYESAPWSPEAWAAPVDTCPLLSTRLVSSSSSRQNEVITLVVRCGSQDGVQAHTLRAETHRDLATWARTLVQGSHNAVAAQRELACRCVWQRKPCQLLLHYEDGFTLIEGQANTLGREQKVLMKAPFESLRSSGDDGLRLLWLDIGGDEGEMEFDLESCPKPFVFILHNFLSAKIHRLGLYA